MNNEFVKRAIEASLANRTANEVPGVIWSQQQADWEGVCKFCQHHLSGTQAQLRAPWKHGLCQGDNACQPK